MHGDIVHLSIVLLVKYFYSWRTYKKIAIRLKIVHGIERRLLLLSKFNMSTEYKCGVNAVSVG